MALCAAVLLVFGGYRAWGALKHSVTGADRFRVKAVEISGCTNLSRSEIATLLSVREGDFIWGFSPSREAAAVCAARPEVERVDIRRTRGVVAVHVTERIPVAAVIENGVRRGVDARNTIFPLRGALASAHLALIDPRSDAERAALVDFACRWPAISAGLAPAVRFYWAAAHDAGVELSDGMTLVWGPPEAGPRDAEKRGRLGQALAAAVARGGAAMVDVSLFEDGRIIVRPRPVARGRTIPFSEAHS